MTKEQQKEMREIAKIMNVTIKDVAEAIKHFAKQ